MAKNLKRLRGAKNQIVVAQAAGVSRYTYQDLEYATGNPTVESVHKVARYFRVPLSEVHGE